MSRVQEYIEAFRSGEEFAPPSEGLIVGGQLEEDTLQQLWVEMLAGNEEVRENIVALVVDLALQLDPLTRQGAEALRHKKIVTLLAGAGLSKPDAGREAAMDALRKLVTHPILAHFEDAIIRVLEDEPTEESFLLVAKAKPRKAKPLVEKLALEPDWQEVQEVKIALAALGEKDIEEGFIAEAKAATDGLALADALGTLALVGTPKSLTFIAEQLRTPLIIEVPGAFQKSVRLNVLEALLYNYPDQPVLYPNNIIEESDYAAAEDFCIKTFGITYDMPRPPFMTFFGFPSPIPN